MDILDITKDHLKKALLLRRRVAFGGEVKGELIDEVRDSLVKLAYGSSEPITLVIDSYGGSVECGFKLMNVIDSLGAPVDGVVYGVAKSMAANILQMCRRRMMMPGSLLYFHYPRISPEIVIDDDGRYKEHLEVLADLAARRSRIVEELLARRSGKPVEAIRDIRRRGEYFDFHYLPEPALADGFIDEIVTDFKLIPDQPEGERGEKEK